MIRVLLAAFLIAHGLIHGGIYAVPKPPDEKAPFDPGHSWVLAGLGVAVGPARRTATLLAWLTAGLFALAGALLLGGAGGWAAAAVAAAAAGLVLKLGYFHAWLSLGVLLDLGVLTAVGAGWPASPY
jgi:hypothetical protein